LGGKLTLRLVSKPRLPELFNPIEVRRGRIASRPPVGSCHEPTLAQLRMARVAVVISELCATAGANLIGPITLASLICRGGRLVVAANWTHETVSHSALSPEVGTASMSAMGGKLTLASAVIASIARLSNQQFFRLCGSGHGNHVIDPLDGDR